MVQDCGYDYIYLRHECASTRMNLNNHSYRDVTLMPMEEFDSESFECSTESIEQANNPNLWLCGASKSSMQTDDSQWHREVEKEDYIPCPFLETLMEHVEWMHYLITLDTTITRPGSKFYDKEGYDMHPLSMISILNSREKETPISNLLVDEVSIEDVPIEPTYPGEENNELTPESNNEEDWEVLEEELDKVRLRLRHREAVDISTTLERR